MWFMLWTWNSVPKWYIVWKRYLNLQLKTDVYSSPCRLIYTDWHKWPNHSCYCGSVVILWTVPLWIKSTLLKNGKNTVYTYKVATWLSSTPEPARVFGVVGETSHTDELYCTDSSQSPPVSSRHLLPRHLITNKQTCFLTWPHRAPLLSLSPSPMDQTGFTGVSMVTTL